MKYVSLLTEVLVVAKWQIIVCAVFLYQYGLVQIVIKKVGASEGSRTRKLVWQYFFAFLLALTAILIVGQPQKLGYDAVIVAIIGAGVSFGCYCHWRAYDISMSRTALASNLDDLIAMGLGYAALGELQVLNPVLAAGIIVSVASAIFFAKIKRGGNGQKEVAGKFPLWVLGYTLTFGVALFSMRFFHLRGMNILLFVTMWYFGAWLGSLLVRFVVMGKKESGAALDSRGLAKVLLMAFGVWSSTLLGYQLRTLVPITVVQPFQLVAEMSIPTIIGLTVFGEIRNMRRSEIALIMAGLAGVVFIGISF